MKLLALNLLTPLRSPFLASRSIHHTRITTAFDHLHLKRNNLNLFKSTANNALFGSYQLNDPRDFQLMYQDTVDRSKALVSEAQDKNRQRKLVEIFDNLSNTICKAADLCEFLKLTHPSSRFTVPAEEVSSGLSELVEQLNTNKSLYLALKQVVDAGDRFPTDQVDDYVARLFLHDIEQCGIHLDEFKRNQVVKLTNQIFMLSREFVQNSSQPVIISKDSIDKSKLKYVPSTYTYKRTKNIIIKSPYLDDPDEVMRELGYKAYLSYNEEMDQCLVKLLQARKDLADLCGFKSYAHRVLKGSIADNPEYVKEFLELTARRIKPYADRDYRIMENYMRMHSNDKNYQLKAWDSSYLVNFFKKKELNNSLSTSLEYFSLGNCMSGLNLLFNRLYDIELEVQSTTDEYVWVDDVVKVGVVDRQNGLLLGHIYCDLFERENKIGQDCHFTVRGGCELTAGEYQTPIVVLSLNFPLHSFSEPYFLTPHQVDNLFHEFGHAMHSMIARTKYQHVTGTRTSTDLAEVPSILMEHFSSDKKVLRLFAKHHLTGETMSDDKLDNWLLNKKLFMASETQLQVFYAYLDQVYHGEQPLKRSTTDTLKFYHDEFLGVRYVEDTAWQLRFNHLVSYGGRYYSYLVSRAISKLIWDRLFKADPLSAQSGGQLREKLLKYGGSRPPRELVEQLLELELNPSNLADALVNEISEVNTVLDRIVN